VLSIDLPPGVGQLVAAVAAMLVFGLLYALARRRFVKGKSDARTRISSLD
jgi:hypothetical protein